MEPINEESIDKFEQYVLNNIDIIMKVLTTKQLGNQPSSSMPSKTLSLKHIFLK